MKKLIIIGILLLCIPFAFAQNDTIGFNINNQANDMIITYSQKPIPPMIIPMQESIPVKERNNQHMNGSSTGPSKSWNEHVQSCREHRNFNFVTRKWNLVEALSNQKCNRLWSMYLSQQQARGIFYSSPHMPVVTLEDRS